MKTVGDFICSDSERSWKWDWAVWLMLLIALAITWRVAYTNLGDWNLVIALSIGTVKAALVVWYFMELRTAPKLVIMLFGMGLLMALIATILTFTDYLTRGSV